MEIVTNIKDLRKPTRLVKPDEDIKEIVANLFREMKEHEDVVGLSANQLGYNLSIFVMKLLKPLPPVCIINPVITKERGSQLHDEDCLSLPGVTVKVKRPYQVTVKGFNQYFKPGKLILSGLLARVACHEIDHLSGKLIIDYQEGG